MVAKLTVRKKKPLLSGRHNRLLQVILACGATSIFPPLWAGVCNNASPPYEVPAQTGPLLLDNDCSGVGGLVRIVGDVVATNFAILDNNNNQDGWIIDVKEGVSILNDFASYTVRFRSPDGLVQNRGVIENQGSISGAIQYDDDFGNAGPGSIFNASTGVISSSGSTIALQAGGEIINEPGGLIASQTGIAVNAQGLVKVGNSGTIASFGSDPDSAISGNSGAEIDNSGEIIGRLNFFSSGTLNVKNSGTITGLSGQPAIRVSNIPAVIVNSGEINGGAGSPTAIEMGNVNDTLELRPGYLINGAVISRLGFDTLRFGGAGSDSFSLDDVGPTGQYREFESLRLDSGSWTFDGTASAVFNMLGGTMNLGAGSVGTGNFIQSDGVVQNGTLSANLYVLSGGTFDAAFGNINTVRIETGTVQFGSDAVLSTGALLNIGAGGTLNLGASSQTTGSLIVEDGNLINGTLTADGFTVQQGEISASLSGAGALIKNGPGTVELAGQNHYTGGTTILEGELVGTTNSLQGDIGNQAELLFSQGADGTYSGKLSGSGELLIGGSSDITFSGDSSGYSGTTQITSNAGLLVNGQLGGDVDAFRGSLGGSGTILGRVRVAPSNQTAFLSPGTGTGTLTVQGDLDLGEQSTLIFELGQPSGSNDQVNVGGDLRLDGVLRVEELGGFAAGTYTLITYSGALNDQTLDLASFSDGFTAFVDTSTPGQVNLVVEALADTVFADRFQQ